MEANTGNIRYLFKKAICLLAAVFLLAGCSSEQLPVQKETQEESESSTDGTQKKGSEDGQADDRMICWAVPVGEYKLDISEDSIQEINRKLAEDGYDFGLRIISVKGDDYFAELEQSGADIASIGMRDSNEQMPEKAQGAGLFECLDERLAGSKLYESIPMLCWESVRYRDAICLIPNERLRDWGLRIWNRQGQVPESFPRQFDGDIFKLGDYLSADVQMYYGEENLFDFVSALGYVYDSARGLIFTQDGVGVNPLEEERIVEWLRALNGWYHEGKVKIDNKKKDQCAVEFTAAYMGDEWQEYASWQGYAFHRTNGSVGILASSGKKEEAFQLLELLHTDHSYGDLLIYGKEALDEGVPGGTVYIAKMMFGLDTGLCWPEPWDDVFSGAEEKKQYYDENILPSPSLYYEFPEECKTIVEIEKKYLWPEIAPGGKPGEDMITCDDFDAKLKEFREELKGPMDEVLENL